MKSTGIVRKIDELGRVVIPKELRATMNFATKDYMEIYTEEDKIILKKYNPGCFICGSVKDIVEYKGKTICRDCLEEIQKSV